MTGDPFYYSKPWRRMRAIVLREEPFCWCGCGQPSNTVDHKKERATHPELELVRSNLRGAFRNCHNRRTAAESGAFGNPRRPARTIGCDESGRPLDENHHWNARPHATAAQQLST